MESINTGINTAIEEVRLQICETYGADPDQENAEEINEELSDFVQGVMDQAFEPVRELITEALSKAATPGTFAALEAKIDLLLAQRSGNGVQHAAVVPLRNAATPNSGGGNPWSRYQKAWNKWKRSRGETIPTHAGDRSKLCAADYKEFKRQGPEFRDNFLNEWA